MILRIILITLTAILITISASAETKIFLSSRYEIKNKSAQLLLGDIAGLQCNPDVSDKLNTIVIEENLYNDGYIDRDEVNSLLKSVTDDVLFIYGNAVRISQETNTAESADKIITNLKDEVLLVKKGETVNLILIHRGISIELYGKVINDGRLGDMISVELKLLNNNRVKLVKGKVCGINQVEVNL